jgi:hypothetical protein
MSMRMILPVSGLAVAFLFTAAPAAAQETCAQKAEKMKEALQYSVMTSEDKQKIAGQIAQGLVKCNAGENNPWMGVDPRINRA